MTIQHTNRQGTEAGRQIVPVARSGKHVLRQEDKPCDCDLSSATLPRLQDELLIENNQVTSLAIANTKNNPPSSSIGFLWTVSARVTAMTAGLSVYLGGVTMILAKQIERAHCIECWVTKVLPASLLVGLGGYLVSRLDRKNAERSQRGKRRERDVSGETE
jgi:hypothetical protein